MSDFQEKTITTKGSKFCAFCHREHKTGDTVWMKFERDYSGTTTTVVCDAECSMKLRQRESAVAAHVRGGR